MTYRVCVPGLIFLSLGAFGLFGCADEATLSPPPALPMQLQGVSSEDVTTKSGSDWAAFLGPNGDGTSMETGVKPELWKPHPPIQWVLPLGTGYAGPAVVGERLLQFDRYDDLERLTCYDVVSAETIWEHSYPVSYSDMYGYNNGPRCSPISDGERVYTYGVAGQLTCVDLESGDLQWSRDLTKDYGVVQNFFGVASTPFLYGDLLLVMVGGSPPESQYLSGRELGLVKPNGTAVVALNRKTGEERYRVGDYLASYASVSVVKLENREVGLAFLRSGLLGWDPASGESLFSYPWRASNLESVNAAQPIVYEDQILLSETYELGSVLLQAKANRLTVMRQDEGSLRNLSFRAHWSTPVLIDGYLYGCSGRNRPDSDFRCVRWTDGEVMWRERRNERSSALYIDGYLIVLGEDGLLELVKPDPNKHDVVASADLNRIVTDNGDPLLRYPCWAAPVVSHGSLYVRGRNHLVRLALIPDSEGSETDGEQN